jgi:hypothetical protein
VVFANKSGDFFHHTDVLIISVTLYNFIEFHHHLYISHASPDDGLYGLKHVREIKTYVCVTEKPPHFYVVTVYTNHGMYLMMALCGPNMS